MATRSTVSPSLISSFGGLTTTSDPTSLPVSSILVNGPSSTFVFISTFSPRIPTSSRSTPTTSFSSSATTTNDPFFSVSSIASASATEASQQGPPFIQAQILGGIPTRNSDIAANVLALVLFFIGFLAYAFLFVNHKRRGRTVSVCLAVAGFCITRLVTVALRMAWTFKLTNPHLGLTAEVLVTVGTVIIYFINGTFAYRIVRAQHPHLDNSILFKVISRLLIVAVLITTTFLIVATVQSAYTLTLKVRSIDRIIQLYGTAFYALIAFIPIPVLIFSHITAHKPPSTSKFGPSSSRRRLILVIAAAILLTLRAIWMCAATWLAPTSETDDVPWYLKKPVFYVAGFLVELMVVYIFIIGRIDKYFSVARHGTLVGSSSRSSSDRTTPSNYVVALSPPPARRLTSEPKLGQWPSQEPDEEVGLGNSNRFYNDYTSQGGSGSRSRYSAGLRAMTPVSEERMSSQIHRKPVLSQAISKKSSHESLHPPSENPSTSTEHLNLQISTSSSDPSPSDFPLPPLSANRLSRGPVLSILTTFPETSSSREPNALGRTSLALDRLTGLYHLVSAPLTPTAASRLNLTLPESTLQFDPPFDTASASFAASIRQSLASPRALPLAPTAPGESSASGVTQVRASLPQQAQVVHQVAVPQPHQAARASTIQLPASLVAGSPPKGQSPISTPPQTAQALTSDPPKPLLLRRAVTAPPETSSAVHGPPLIHPLAYHPVGSFARSQSLVSTTSNPPLLPPITAPPQSPPLRIVDRPLQTKRSTSSVPNGRWQTQPPVSRAMSNPPQAQWPGNRSGSSPPISRPSTSGPLHSQAPPTFNPHPPHPQWLANRNLNKSPPHFSRPTTSGSLTHPHASHPYISHPHASHPHASHPHLVQSHWPLTHRLSSSPPKHAPVNPNHPPLFRPGSMYMHHRRRSSGATSLGSGASDRLVRPAHHRHTTMDGRPQPQQRASYVSTRSSGGNWSMLNADYGARENAGGGRESVNMDWAKAVE